MDKTRLAKADFMPQPMFNGIPTSDYLNIGYGKESYHETIRKCRFFYENDTIAGTVINRMTDIAITTLRNKHRKTYADEIKYYYDGVAILLTNMLKNAPLAYLIDGMAVPDYRTAKIMGNRIHQRLGRTRYEIPKALWIRNAEYIEVKKGSLGDRLLYLKITPEDKKLIDTEGKPDRIQEYTDLVTLYPEYVAAVKKGATVFRLNARPIFRKMTSYNAYPIPFLKNALGALDHRRALKRMDKITAERMIAAIRQISVGSDEFPADDEDITATKNIVQTQGTSNSQETLLNLYTNHTVKIEWVVPPFETLLSAEKFVEANADVFLSMGFPRLWAVGENERSNSADNKIASVGPIATLEGMRDDILEWVRYLYQHLADLNGFTQYPEPQWSPIALASAMDLLQYAAQFVENETVSRDTIAQLYGTSYESEFDRIEIERVNRPKPQEPTNEPRMGSTDQESVQV